MFKTTDFSTKPFSSRPLSGVQNCIFKGQF